MKTNFSFALIIVLCLLVASCSRKGEVLQRFTFVADSTGSVFAQTRARYSVEFDSSAMGTLVKSINGATNTKTAYWLYFVNAKPAHEAADRFRPQPGDTIEWRLVAGY